MFEPETGNGVYLFLLSTPEGLLRSEDSISKMEE